MRIRDYLELFDKANLVEKTLEQMRSSNDKRNQTHSIGHYPDKHAPNQRQQQRNDRHAAPYDRCANGRRNNVSGN